MNYNTAREMVDAGQVVVREDLPNRFIFMQKGEEQQLVAYLSLEKKIVHYTPTQEDLKAVNFIIKNPTQ